MTPRRFHLLGLCLLAALLTAAAKMTPHEIPASQCSEVYRRYAGQPGIQAAYLCDYRLNDSVGVPVTLLRATDSAAWQQLCSDFAIKPLPEDLRWVKTYFFMPDGPREYGQDMPLDLINLLNEYSISFSYYTQEVMVLHTNTDEQKKAYLKKLLKDAIPETYKHKHKIT